jgi:uncharacterized protein (UPF0261 family)
VAPKTIGILGTMDTKGREHAFVASVVRSAGHRPLTVDVGLFDPVGIEPDVTRHQVAAAAEVDLAALVEQRDRGSAIDSMAHGAAAISQQLHHAGRIDAMISLGGGGGTAIGTAAMRALPIGVPKVMVSTLAAGNTATYVGASDIVMVPAIVDVAGLNRISRRVLSEAATIVCALVDHTVEVQDDRPLIAASMFGNTTECVAAATVVLEEAGYEVLTFHATGIGGRTMESLIDSGTIEGVLDVTTTEWADQIVGGVLAAGADRLGAAARTGTPAIVAPGCCDMVNFHEPDSIPTQFKDRLFYQHTPQVTLMRTTADDCVRIGHAMAEHLNASTGHVTVLIPTRGVSVLSTEGQPFHDTAADQALFETLRSELKERIDVVDVDAAINDPAFAQQCSQALLVNIRRSD